MRLEERIYENAIRLFEDSCGLYKSRSFASAYALAILANEELGKLLMVDHVGFEAHLSDRRDRYERLEHLFSRKMFFSHRNKQAWGAYKPMKGTKFARVEEHLYSGKLERNKQGALYVGFANHRILLPIRFGSSYAYNHLKYTLGCFAAVGELPFVWLFEESTARTRKHVARVMAYLKSMFDELDSPKSLARRKKR